MSLLEKPFPRLSTAGKGKDGDGEGGVGATYVTETERVAGTRETANGRRTTERSHGQSTGEAAAAGCLFR